MHKYNSMLNTLSSIANQTAGLPFSYAILGTIAGFVLKAGIKEQI